MSGGSGGAPAPSGGDKTPFPESVGQAVKMIVFALLGLFFIGLLRLTCGGPVSNDPEHVARVVNLKEQLEVAKLQKELRQVNGQAVGETPRCATPVDVRLSPLGLSAKIGSEQGVVDDTIYLSREGGQREVTLELSTTEWSPWIAFLVTPGATGGSIQGLVTPELGFKAQVEDELVQSGFSSREVTVRRGSVLTARGLRRIRYKALEPNQSLNIKYCD